MFHSRHCSPCRSRRRHAHRSPRRLSIRRSRHQDGAPARQWKWPARSLPLDLYSSFLSVSNPPHQPSSPTSLTQLTVLTRRGYFVEYLLEHPAVRSVWDEFVYHPFVMALGNGTLPVESFKGYIVQDYLYLVRSSSVLLSIQLKLTSSQQVHFSRANALAAYKAKSIGDISRVRPTNTQSPERKIANNPPKSNEIVSHILHEMKLHINYCNSFGISEPEIQATQELQGKESPPSLKSPFSITLSFTKGES